MNKAQKAEAVKKYGPVYATRGEEEVLQLFEIDKISEKDGNEIIEGIKAAIANSFNAASTAPVRSEGPKIERPKPNKEMGYHIYDKYKVQREVEEYVDDNGNEKQRYTGNYIKVGQATMTNILIEPWRAKMFNDQSANSLERLFEVID